MDGLVQEKTFSVLGYIFLLHIHMSIQVEAHGCD